MSQIKNNEEYFERSFRKLAFSNEGLRDTTFEECQFIDCDFSQTNFENCKFINCEFLRSNLSLVKLTNSKLFGVSFAESKLIGIDWTKAAWASYHVDFELKFYDCIMNDSSFFGLTLNALVLNNCKLHDVDFREGDFSQSLMNCCDFQFSQFLRTNVSYVDFSHSSSYVIDIFENQVKGAKFSRFEALGLLETLDIELVD